MLDFVDLDSKELKIMKKFTGKKPRNPVILSVRKSGDPVMWIYVFNPHHFIH